jgi:hypothetical protein
MLVSVIPKNIVAASQHECIASAPSGGDKANIQTIQTMQAHVFPNSRESFKFSANGGQSGCSNIQI